MPVFQKFDYFRWETSKSLFLTTLDRGAGTCLESGSAFDPETLTILETAFHEAWISLKSSGSGTISRDFGYRLDGSSSTIRKPASADEPGSLF